jgi:putative transposase
MTMRKEAFQLGEWYHCYNKSIEGRHAFVDARDYYRFLELLYLANDTYPLRRDDVGLRKFEEVLALPRGKRLVHIEAFCLMPDHYHLVLKEVVEGGITSFMRKIGTAYTLYFNSRHRRSGNLFLKPFKSIHAPKEKHLGQLVSYVHCSPATLVDPKWKNGPVVDPQFLGQHVAAYPYSSLGTHTGARTQTSPLLDQETSSSSRTIPIQKMLQEARLYWAENRVP